MLLAVQEVGFLASAIQDSQQWREVPFESVHRTVLRLIHEGLLRAANKEQSSAMEVSLGVAPREVEEMLRTRPLDIPLY